MAPGLRVGLLGYGVVGRGVAQILDARGDVEIRKILRHTPDKVTEARMTANADEILDDPDIDVICVDPPRKGCDSKCLETILEIRPERVVYVSCDPATLARDLRILADGGYELRKVRPVDQFGHTVHVETVCLLTHN